MINTITLYRPVGVTELELIIDSGMKSFPPRLDWQPIFYPVLNSPYAEQIAKDWNTPDEFSGFAGFVTAFEIPEEYFNRFEIQTVGGDIHQELWVPSEQLAEFNANIVNGIRVEKAFYGEKYVPNPKIEKLLRNG
jgi:hypothetical protein